MTDFCQAGIMSWRIFSCLNYFNPTLDLRELCHGRLLSSWNYVMTDFCQAGIILTLLKISEIYVMTDFCQAGIMS